MTGAAQLRRYASRPDWLLTAAALVIMLSTSVAGHTWQLPARWPELVVVLTWLPLVVLTGLAAVTGRTSGRVAAVYHEPSIHPAGRDSAATMRANRRGYPARWLDRGGRSRGHPVHCGPGDTDAGSDWLYLNWPSLPPRWAFSSGNGANGSPPPGRRAGSTALAEADRRSRPSVSASPTNC
jgi:hypothetical protein